MVQLDNIDTDVNQIKDLNHVFETISKLAQVSANTIQMQRETFKNNQKDALGEGLSFLQFKNCIMINYMMNLIQIMLKKCNMESIENSETINRLIEFRVIIEKMRNTQHKLKYQIEKAINLSKNVDNIDETLLLKPNLNNLLDEDNNQDTNENNKKSKKNQNNNSNKSVKPEIYIAPKLKSVQFEENEKKAKKEELLEKAKKRAASTVLMKEFQDQFDEEAGPEEINELTIGKRKSIRLNQNKEAYEEDYLVRLKEKKKKLNQDQDNLLTINTLGDNLTHFQDVSVLNVNDAEKYLEDKKSGKKKKNLNFINLPKKLAKKLAKKAARRKRNRRMNL